jgi:D-sedoheptulose 7-phosphate isomerase
MLQKIEHIITASIAVKQSIYANTEMLMKIQEVSQLIANSFQKGNKLLLCGNGGSAADAQHLAAEFTGRFYTDRNPLPAEALHVNTSFLTAVANDYSYDVVFQRAVKAHGRPGDILMSLSTSGNSKNCILAMRQALEQNMNVIAFTGSSGGEMKHSCHFLINVPSTDTPRIQESHILIGHIICQLVEEILIEKKFI